MRCFTFKSLKSLKAPGLDGFDIGLLNLHWERKQEWEGVAVSKRKQMGEKERRELQLAWLNPTLAIVKGPCLLIEVSASISQRGL